MDKYKTWALAGLVLGPLLFLRSLDSSVALERPAHSATILLAAIGSFLILSARFLARYSSLSATSSYSALPLQYVEPVRSPSRSPSRSLPTSPITIDSPPVKSTTHLLYFAFATLVAALGMRVEVTRRIIAHAECAGHTYTPILPLCFAASDFWKSRMMVPAYRPSNDMEDSVYDLVEQYWARSPLRYLLPTALLSICSALLLRSFSAPASTYICPAATMARHTVMISRLLALPLDFVIILSIDHIFRAASTSRTTWPRRPLELVGLANILVAFLLLIIGIIYFIASPDDRPWMSSMPLGFSWSIIKLTIIAFATIMSLCLCIHVYAPLITTAILVFAVMSGASIVSSWRDTNPFPPKFESFDFLLCCCIFSGFILLLFTQTIEQSHSNRGRALFARMPGWFSGLMLILFGLRCIGWLAHKSNANFHPVDLLIFEAKVRHEKYAAQASSSLDLPAAIKEYQSRYKRQPPPNFDKWFNYTTTRQSRIMDDFDRINEDLLPFWALSPAEIRQRTWEAISNPWNDIAGISIRNGKADISPNVMPTHRWMLDGINEMVNHFSEWLPDMDLGFNLNDECRIAVPYESIEKMRRNGLASDAVNRTVLDSFSPDRSSTWQAIPEQPLESRPFKELSFQRTFSEFGKVGCPPGSAARDDRYWDTGSLCTSCAAPHSLGTFLANWTKSADVCHQPDLANLHGFYLSPAAFKASHELYPVFSQSKAPGYNDILYPSAWNYMDKVRYQPNGDHPDPPFEKKKKTLFWRGATSEGVSPGSGTWKGMSRQRFIHLANNINETTPPQPVLLPYPFAPSREKLQYASVPIQQLTKLVSADVHVVDTIVRCGGKDCVEQSKEFAPLVAPSDFQAHWSYKYLLDLDGAGFSGRFLPFLSSKSLPFKAALFREWYDSRLEPWYHFVPLDLRGHGFWATLVYFAGLEGEVLGRRVSMKGHDREGEMIAEKGREWAGQVLRKEDMEIYMFRLLLEWGRLTDDRREDLGFSLP